jgi:hypothetical protein
MLLERPHEKRRVERFVLRRELLLATDIESDVCLKKKKAMVASGSDGQHGCHAENGTAYPGRIYGIIE